MQAPNGGLTEGRGEVLLLDILSHRMSTIATLRQTETLRRVHSMPHVGYFCVDSSTERC